MRQVEDAGSVGDAVGHPGNSRHVFLIVGAGARDEAAAPAEHAVERPVERADDGGAVRRARRVHDHQVAQLVPELRHLARQRVEQLDDFRLGAVEAFLEQEAPIEDGAVNPADEAIRIALVNARVIRVLTGFSAASSGKTIYDAAITNTTIDQEQARFDPAFEHRSRWSHTETPTAVLDPFFPNLAAIVGSRTDDYRAETALRKTNVLGGQWALSWIENPTRFASDPTGLFTEGQALITSATYQVWPSLGAQYSVELWDTVG